MMNFRFIAHFDTLAVNAHLFALKPGTWKGVEARGEVNVPEIGLGASLLLRGHQHVTRDNWLKDQAVRDLPPLLKWNSMQKLLGKAHDAIMADHAIVTRGGKPILTGQMARAMVSRLDPGSTIFWHVDDGPYHARTARFHLPLTTNPGCVHYSGPESLHLEAGTLWYFNNHVRHSAANFGKSYRVHLIFEMYKHRDEKPDEEG